METTHANTDAVRNARISSTGIRLPNHKDIIGELVVAIFIVIMAFLFGCGGKPSTCVTACGMKSNDLDDGQCEEVQKTEMLTIWYLSEYTVHPTWTVNGMCSILKDYTIRVVTEASFKVGGVDASGFTNCRVKKIDLATPASGNFRESALSHEMAHAIQGCMPYYDDEYQDYRVGYDVHFGWDSHGISDAVEKVRKADGESLNVN